MVTKWLLKSNYGDKEVSKTEQPIHQGCLACAQISRDQNHHGPQPEIAPCKGPSKLLRKQVKCKIIEACFEELEIGQTVFTHKHTVTTTDIVNVANVSGDNFYAHMDETSLDGTIFEERVAHGYFILSKAAGLFVDPAKGPVLLNYGIDECRFTKPVYAGATVGVRFTVKEKIDQGCLSLSAVTTVYKHIRKKPAAEKRETLRKIENKSTREVKKMFTEPLQAIKIKKTEYQDKVYLVKLSSNLLKIIKGTNQ